MEKYLSIDSQARAALLKRETALRETRAQPTNRLTGLGISGNRKPLNLKCLHAHTADFLACELNPVGRQVMESITWPNNCRLCETL